MMPISSSDSETDTESSNLDSKEMDRKEDKALFCQTLKHVAKIRNLDFLALLDSGPNGAVGKMTNLFLKTEVAVKVEPFQDRSIISAWSKMNHVNILPLIEIMPIETETFRNVPLQWTVYIMPFYSSTLKRELFSREFIQNPSSFQKAVGWIKQTLEGLAYMHRNGCYHLDIKEDNILINHSGQAVLADFTFLIKDTEVNRDYIGCPVPYKPPETIVTSQETLNSEQVDIWALAIMILNIFTSGETYNFIPDMKNDIQNGWYNYLRPFLKCVKRDYPVFSSLLCQAFPRHEFTNQEIGMCWSLVQALLKEEPDRRPHIADILKHDFMLYEDTGAYIKNMSMKYLQTCENCASLVSLPSWNSTKDLMRLNDCTCGQKRDSTGKQLERDVNYETLSKKRNQEKHQNCARDYFYFMSASNQLLAECGI